MIGGAKPLTGDDLVMLFKFQAKMYSGDIKYPLPAERAAINAQKQKLLIEVVEDLEFAAKLLAVANGSADDGSGRLKFPDDLPGYRRDEVVAAIARVVGPESISTTADAAPIPTAKHAPRERRQHSHTESSLDMFSDDPTEREAAMEALLAPADK